MVGVCASLFLAASACRASRRPSRPTPVSRPGDSPFQQPQRTGSGGAIAQALVLLGTIVLSAPALWWAWLALTRDIEYAMPALWGGIAIGVGVLVVGIAIGSDRRSSAAVGGSWSSPSPPTVSPRSPRLN